VTSDLTALIQDHISALPDEAKQPRRGVTRTDERAFAPDRMAWERQPWENDVAFEMFVHYRDLPATHRSLDAAYRLYTGVPEGARVRSRAFRIMSVQNRWVERVEAYSMYNDEHLRQALEEARVRVRLEYLDIGREMRTKATEALVVLNALVYETDPETGEKRAKSALSVRQIIELTRAAHDYERFALMMDQWNKPAGTTVNIMNVTDTQLLRDAKDVLSAYETVGVIVDAADP
jgi:hypothetical protein